MSAHVLINGVLFRDAERKISKNGNEYAAATIREGNGDARHWWKVMAFNEGAVELLRLKDGDAVSVQGALDVSTYQKAGETRVGLSIMAERVLALRQPKARAAKQVRRATRTASPSRQRLDRHADDDAFGD
jgi:single-stranded DNA-binding protein